MGQNGIFQGSTLIDQEIIDLPKFFPLRVGDCHSGYLAGPLPSLQGSSARFGPDLARM
jgi:hypothetical protein